MTLSVMLNENKYAARTVYQLNSPLFPLTRKQVHQAGSAPLRKVKMWQEGQDYHTLRLPPFTQTHLTDVPH